MGGTWVAERAGDAPPEAMINVLPFSRFGPAVTVVRVVKAGRLFARRGKSGLKRRL